VSFQTVQTQVLSLSEFHLPPVLLQVPVNRNKNLLLTQKREDNQDLADGLSESQEE